MSAKKIERLDGIGPLAERYQVFLHEECGVLHDGKAPYPVSVKAFLALKGAG
jgi:hypothetical protein